jgi:hypothetical protein
MKDKKNVFIKDAVNEMFKISNNDVSYDDVTHENEWYIKYSMTSEQEAEWKTWFIKELVKRRLCLSKKHANNEFIWFNLNYGLTIKEE